MVPAILGLVGALVYGSADFLGGLASQRIKSVLATALAAGSGLVALLVALPFIGGTWSAEAMIWGGLSGVTGAIAIPLLYACLAIGPMSILSPLTAVVSAVVPLTVGLVGGDRFEPIGYWAIGVALVAVVLVGFVPERGAVRASGKGILMAIGSGAMIGAFLILIDLTPEDSGLVPLVMNRAVNGVVMFSVVGILALRAARKARPGSARSVAAIGRERAGMRLAVACGVLDAAANTLFLAGVRLGDLTVMSVLTAMYPAGTILLAAIVLKERIAPVQWVGLVLAVAAAAMLAIA